MADCVLVGTIRHLTPGWRIKECVATELVASLANADAPVVDVYRFFYPEAVQAAAGFNHAVGTNAAERLTRI
jgi:hypothetical protein